MKKLILLLSIVFIASTAGAKTVTIAKTDVVSVYDGDTFKVNIKGWPDIIGKKISIRVNGINTPEIRGKCDHEKALAKVAKQHTIDFLNSGNYIELRNIERGKYFRIVADVYVNRKSLTESLYKAKLGYFYDGGSKIHQSWCTGNKGKADDQPLFKL